MLHLLAGATFGLIFEAVVAPRLPGPYWLRGILMAQFENATLWPVLMVLDRIHPAVRSGELTPMNRPIYFGQAVWRHLALGVVMGALLGSPQNAAPRPPTGDSRASRTTPRW
jgi:hypothetical protein